MTIYEYYLMFKNIYSTSVNSQNKSTIIYEYYLMFKNVYSISKEVLPTKWFQYFGVHNAQKGVVMEYECYTFFCNYC